VAVSERIAERLAAMARYPAAMDRATGMIALMSNYAFELAERYQKLGDDRTRLEFSLIGNRLFDVAVDEMGMTPQEVMDA
jgi:hypothetical protein